LCIIILSRRKGQLPHYKKDTTDTHTHTTQDNYQGQGKRPHDHRPDTT
jgi:hypothetical protein